MQDEINLMRQSFQDKDKEIDRLKMRELISSQNSSRFKSHKHRNLDEEPTSLTDYYNEANAVSLAILANHLEHSRLL